MILLADLIDRYRSDLEQRHGHQLLPGHHRALQAMRRCRNQHSRVMVLECNSCHNQVSLPHSCGHRSCPHCQHHESQQWLEGKDLRAAEGTARTSTQGRCFQRGSTVLVILRAHAWRVWMC